MCDKCFDEMVGKCKELTCLFHGEQNVKIYERRHGKGMRP